MHLRMFGKLSKPVLICMISFALSFVSLASEGSSKKPHIIFVLADDLGFNDVGYHAKNYGLHGLSPTINSLAESGIRLENYYVQIRCSPSRGQLMSGRYQIHTGAHDLFNYCVNPGFPLDNIFLPEQLRQCGYRTHMLGKWHLGGSKEDYTPWKRGFDTFYGTVYGIVNYFTKMRGNGVGLTDSEKGPDNSTWGEYLPHVYTRRAKEILRNHDQSKPLFLYLAYELVHTPDQVPPGYEEVTQQIKGTSSLVKNRKIHLEKVSVLDESIKNITEELKKNGMWEDTLFVFSTDNGGTTTRGNNWPLRGGKHTYWEGGIRAVGFLHGKLLGLNGKTNTINRKLSHISDWLPTLLSAAQCPLVEGTQPLDGVDQWNAITKNAPAARTEILHNILPNTEKHEKIMQSGFDISQTAAIRMGDWKLITSQKSKNRLPPPESRIALPQESVSDKIVRLYNIANDPEEEKELSDENPEIVEKMLERLAEHQKTAVPPLSLSEDRDGCNPDKHGGFWLPWLK